MTKKNKQEIMLTASGHQADKDLTRVPVKVSPSLQAMIANQMELIEMLEGKIPQNSVFIEQHKVEVLQVEEEVASAFSNHMQKKEKAKERRQLKKKVQEEQAMSNEQPFPVFEESTNPFPDAYNAVSAPQRGTLLPFNEEESSLSLADNPEFKPELNNSNTDLFIKKNTIDKEIDKEISIERDMLSDKSSPGLPSAKYKPRTHIEVKPSEIDVRRVAIGASIKALETFLGRQLTEEEMNSIESQVDSYLG